MSLWSQPPPPQVIGPVNSTPPIPHSPIPAQGDQPPRRQVAFAVMMAVAVAAWPADLEPRLQAPNERQQKIAPLTLTYGQQPPRVSLANLMSLTVAAWPPDLEPRLGRPNEQRQKIAPLTLTYGQTPPVKGPLAPTALQTIVGAWPLDCPLVLRTPINAAVLPPPPIAAYIPPHPTGWIDPAIWQANHEPVELAIVTTFVQAPTNPDQPPRQRPLSPSSLAITLQAWQPPDPQPVQRLQSVAPTFPRVDQPPLRGPQSPIFTVVAAWTDAPVTPRATPSAAWNIPPVLTSVPYTRPPALLWAAWAESFVRPPSPVTIAPLTLTYGSQPAPQPPLTTPTLTAILANGPETWGAQTAPKNAAWNIQVFTFVPPNRFPGAIYAAWQPPDPQPVQRITSVVPTFPAVSQPPIRGPQNPIQTVVAAWAQTLVAWTEVPTVRQRVVQIAPLTLTYGATPTPRAPLSVSVLNATVLTWVQTWDAQWAPRHADWPPFVAAPFTFGHRAGPIDQGGTPGRHGPIDQGGSPGRHGPIVHQTPKRTL